MKANPTRIMSATGRFRWTTRLVLAVFASSVMLFTHQATGATLLWKAPNATVHTNLPFTSLEFENPLSGLEYVLSYPVLEWRDADYNKSGHPLYDDWSTNGTPIDGNLNEIWMRQSGQSISTATTVASTIVSIHLVGDDNDGQADVYVDGLLVAQLDMYKPYPPSTALVVVRGLSPTTHQITVQDMGDPSGGANDDVATMGAAALGEAKLKWEQPPLPAEPTNVFYGWNEPSMENQPPIAADDWVCTTTNPITKIRWWGSFLDWQQQYPPQPIVAFVIRFWTDVPQGVDPIYPDFSHPGDPVGPFIYCTNFTSQFVGWDYDPITGQYEACFLYEQNLLPEEWFYQDPYQGTNIYWLSIEAILSNTTNIWGWKTRPRDTNSLAPDDAVRFDPSVPIYEPLWWPDPTNSWDLAFELFSETEEWTTKWWQEPDLSPDGMDVHDSDNPSVPPPYLLADDFLCTNQEPITNITIWGSWTNDYDWQNVVFTLSIHDDLPATNSPTGYSMPDTVLWQFTFLPGQYSYSVYASPIDEWWLTPPTNAVWPGDHACWQYDFNIPEQEAFTQEGDPTNPKVYWLDVQAHIQGTPPPPEALFGWKTSTNHWNDDAVWVDDFDPPTRVWNELRYPPTHPREGDSVDLAFRLNQRWELVEEVKWSQPPEPYAPTNAFHGWNEYSVYESTQIVADDWVCTNTTPVTDIHWWGSFIGWSGGIPETTGPTLPAGFWITIWTDVPQGTNDPFSHPGNVEWQIYCTNFAVEYAGYDLDPRDPNAIPETCYKFSQDLLEEEYFHQNPDGLTNIYWISIAAVYTNTQPIEYPWGWKTRLRDTNSLAPDDAVRIFDPTAPIEGASYANGEPIWWPTESESWDMAFALTTKEIITPTNDFGDAPSPYPTLLANTGARHTVVPGILMGALIDAELDGLPNATATGDDINNQPDEDGVVLTTLLIPGETATVQVTASVAGQVSAWIDFDADGSWATVGDQIANNAPVVAGANNLNFTVPLTAAARGSYTFARFRFSTAGVAGFTGQAADGEVEDYRLYIEELDYGDAQDAPFPTLYANNGARHVIFQGVFMGAQIDSEQDGQPNAAATGDDTAGLNDEDGVTLVTGLVPGQPAQVQVNASIAGGWINGWIDFGADGSWATAGDQIANNVPSVAGANLVNFVVPPNAAAGSNVYARFRFSTMALPTFTGIAANGEVEDYRWDIEELDYGDAPDPSYPTFLANNGARHVAGTLRLGAAIDGEADGQPDAFATGDDLAGVDDEDGVVFTTALIAGTPAKVQVTASAGGILQGWLDWNRNGSWADATEQIIVNYPVVAGANLIQFSVPNVLSSGKTFARFRLATTNNVTYTGYSGSGEVEDYSLVLYPIKTLQAPEQGSEGVDVSMATPLADDFICNESGPITDIHIWGSFYKDVLPVGGAGNMTLTLTFYADVPAGVGGTNYSRPGAVLWSRTFGPGQYTAANNFTTAGEWWHNPSVPPAWIWPGDTNMYQFDFYVTNEPFLQTEGIIYWLGVSNASLTTSYTNGWKTTPQGTGNGPDDAAWRDSAGHWHDLRYQSGQSLDLAFALSGAQQAVDLDFSDAPSPYPTLQANNGARHYAVPGFYLGTNAFAVLSQDTEADGFPHPQALGDDLNNWDDEDGVTVGPVLIRGSNASVTVLLTSGTGTGILDGWVDFNADNDWADPGERVFTNTVLSSGANALSFTTPAGAELGTNFARFRLTSLGIGVSTGLAPDGEVEDYRVEILQTGPSTNVVITNIVVTNIVGGTQGILLQWNAEAGVSYQVQEANTLTNLPVVWSNVPPILIDYQKYLTRTNTLFERYYRIWVPYVSP